MNYWKHAALKQLRKEWLKSEHEKQEADTLLRLLKSCRRRAGSHRHGIAALCRGIKYLSTYRGHINSDIQDRLKAQLIKAVLQFRFDR